jgi:3-dehydroquinate synthetase
MLLEAYVSQARGRLSDEEFSRIVALLARFPRPALPTDVEIESLSPYIHRDKKARQGRLRMVLLGGLGQAELSEIEAREIQEAWEGILRRM